MFDRRPLTSCGQVDSFVELAATDAALSLWLLKGYLDVVKPYSEVILTCVFICLFFLVSKYLYF
jgi:hypothetical protein